VYLKHALTFFGLLSDLVGAVLLSIPMIWNIRTVVHSILKIMKRIKFFLYGYSGLSRDKPIFSRDVQEAQARMLSTGVLFACIFGTIALKLMWVYASATKATSLPFGPSTGLVDIIVEIIVECIMVISFACAVLVLYLLGKLPLYVAHALMWVARGNHERRIGFIGLGILCIGFLLQAAVNLM
jgi:hypothetical protein